MKKSSNGDVSVHFNLQTSSCNKIINSALNKEDHCLPLNLTASDITAMCGVGICNVCVFYLLYDIFDHVPCK